MGVFTGIPRVSDPPPYEYLLWAEHEAPPGYYWFVERVVEGEFSFRLRLIVQQPFSGSAWLALALSLRKWVVLAASLERLVKWLGPDQSIYMDDGGSDTCALCTVYWRSSGSGSYCRHCPIYAKTGQGLCQDTPYKDFIEWGFRPVGDFLEIAGREVIWLRALRDELGGYLEDRPWPPKTS